MSADKQPNLVKFGSSSPPYDSDKPLKIGDTKMIEQKALVVGVERGYAWVIPQQQGAGCKGCSGGSCSSSSAFDFLKREPQTQKLRVLNPVHARHGDHVVIGVQGEALVVYSFLAYLLPLLSLVLMAVVGREMFTLFALHAELGAVLGGITGLLGGLRFANSFCSNSLRSDDFQPVILRTQEPPVYTGMISFP